jgi:hypothetical protein
MLDEWGSWMVGLGGDWNPDDSEEYIEIDAESVLYIAGIVIQGAGGNQSKTNLVDTLRVEYKEIEGMVW